MQRLTDPLAIYQLFCSLRRGDVIPDELYIRDYEDGSIPRWVLIERVELKHGGLQLLVEDQSPYQVEIKRMFGKATLPRRGILTFPDKSSCTPVCSGERNWPRTNKMASLEQQARIANKRAQAQEGQGAARAPIVAPSPWIRATVIDEQVLAKVQPRLPASHLFHDETVVYVRRDAATRGWAVWDGDEAAMLLSEEVAKRAFRSVRHNQHILLADHQDMVEECYLKAQALRTGATVSGRRT